MSLSIDVSLGLGGAVGYMLGGLDWTGTALGRAFKSQEQVLFLFAGIIFIISVTLHMLSIPERPFTPSHQLKSTGIGESTSQLSFRPLGHTPPLLDVISEEDASAQIPAPENNESDNEKGERDFVAIERVRSKSDSVLAMPDATVELDPDLDRDTQFFLPDVHHFLPDTPGGLKDDFKPSEHSVQCLSPHGGPPILTDVMTVLDPMNPVLPKLKNPTNSPHFLLRITYGSRLKQVKFPAAFTFVSYIVKIV